MLNSVQEPESAPEYFNFCTDVMDRWALVRPDALALWWAQAGGGREEKFTFQQLAQLSRQGAAFLQACGVQRGDRVLVLLPRWPQWWIVMLALTRLGAVPVPASLQLTPREIAHRLAAARIAAVISSEDGIEKIAGFTGVRFLAGGSERPGWNPLGYGFANRRSRV